MRETFAREYHYQRYEYTMPFVNNFCDDKYITLIRNVNICAKCNKLIYFERSSYQYFHYLV